MLLYHIGTLKQAFLSGERFAAGRRFARRASFP